MAQGLESHPHNLCLPALYFVQGACKCTDRPRGIQNQVPRQSVRLGQLSRVDKRGDVVPSPGMRGRRVAESNMSMQAADAGCTSALASTCIGSR